jgi:ferredoxin
VRVKIDQELCTGHGRCQVLAGRVYKLDSNGYNIDRGKTLEIPPDLEAEARKGAKLCPERAIAILAD